MATKDKIRVTLESRGSLVMLVVETEKRGEMVRNLEVESKMLELIDKRTESERLENDDRLSTV